MVTRADGTAERDAAILMISNYWRTRRRKGQRSKTITVGADKGYDTRDSVQTVRELGATPYVTQNTARPGGSAIDGRTTRHSSYAISQRKRPLIEKVFGWMKQTGGMRKTRFRGLLKVAWQFTMTAAAYNLWRLPRLQSASA